MASIPRDGLATPAQAAAYLCKSVQALAILRHRGRGPVYIKAGRSIRYAWADVDAWVEAGKRTRTAEDAAQ